MKVSAMTMIAITSMILLLITILVIIGSSFGWVFYLTCVGQIMVIIMVYTVLTDSYTTDKTFEDFYEDHSISRDE